MNMGRDGVRGPFGGIDRFDYLFTESHWNCYYVNITEITIKY